MLISSWHCHGASAGNTTLKRSSLCSALLTPGTSAHFTGSEASLTITSFMVSPSTCEISSSWSTLYSMAHSTFILRGTNSPLSSVGRTLLRYHARVALCLARHWAHFSCLSCALTCAALGSWSCLGHPQPPDRSQHGCTVGVNRDPPVWPSTQAGWWRNQSASPTYVGRRATISRRRGL